MTDEVLISIDGATGRLSLNRPRAIHALTHGMCTAMTAALLAWREDGRVGAVLLDHAPAPDGDPKYARGFCAGGDVVALARSAAGDGVAARAFWHDEYRLNHLLFAYPKPTVAFVDGIVMGGGVGIADPCRYRVATENTVFAMPETGIGLFPDVGGGWFLSRLPGRIGRFVALTGARLKGAECVALGMCSHYVAAASLPAVKQAIAAAPERIEAILDEAAAPLPDAPILAHRAAIDRLFASDRLEEILAALEADGGDWAAAQRTAILAKSPTAGKVTLRLLAEGAGRTDFADEMRVEYAIASHFAALPDFPEGVRALLIDKDNRPAWRPDTPEQVSDAAIDAIFAPLPEDAAWTPIVAAPASQD